MTVPRASNPAVKTNMITSGGRPGAVPEQPAHPLRWPCLPPHAPPPRHLYRSRILARHQGGDLLPEQVLEYRPGGGGRHRPSRTAFVHHDGHHPSGVVDGRQPDEPGRGVVESPVLIGESPGRSRSCRRSARPSDPCPRRPGGRSRTRPPPPGRRAETPPFRIRYRWFVARGVPSCAHPVPSGGFQAVGHPRLVDNPAVQDGGVGHRQLERGGQHRSLAHHQVHEVAPLPALLPPHPPRLVPLPLLEELPVAEYPPRSRREDRPGCPARNPPPGPNPGRCLPARCGRISSIWKGRSPRNRRCRNAGRLHGGSGGRPTPDRSNSAIPAVMHPRSRQPAAVSTLWIPRAMKHPGGIRLPPWPSRR